MYELVIICLPFLFLFFLSVFGFRAGLGVGLGFIGGLHEGHGVALGFERGSVARNQSECFAECLGRVLVAFGGQGGLTLLHQAVVLDGLFLGFFFAAGVGISRGLGCGLGLFRVA